MGRKVRKFDGALGPGGCRLPWGHFVVRVHGVQRVVVAAPPQI